MKFLKLIGNLKAVIMEDTSCGEVMKYLLLLFLLIVEIIVSVVLLTASILKKICSSGTVKKMNHFFLGTFYGNFAYVLITGIVVAYLCGFLKI